VDLVLPLTQTFQVLTKTVFNIVTTMNVEIALALEVIKAIAPVVTGVGIAMIALLIALFALALSLMRD